MTPKEWERLQGFPDDWTAGLANVHRYKQMGNSVAVPVIKAVASNIIKELQNPTQPKKEVSAVQLVLELKIDFHLPKSTEDYFLKLYFHELFQI